MHYFSTFLTIWQHENKEQWDINRTKKKKTWLRLGIIKSGWLSTHSNSHHSGYYISADESSHHHVIKYTQIINSLGSLKK